MKRKQKTNERSWHFGPTDRCAGIVASPFISFQTGSYTMLSWVADDSEAITQLKTS